ncbi:MAG: nucleotide exchange factor GrpE [Verrucomicrobiae bacterium]|nr:nucleotide exchange factor GrpE [Verrucomicrobiae bacterium]NNJ44124.1 nucleotide exchange factor GrpE [Akkermansiaceae bacterium]
MQEQTQQSEEMINEENSAGEEAVENDATPTEGVDTQTTEEDAEAELDPWEALEIEAAKWKDQAIRTAAELDNFRKRMTREKLDAVRYGNQRLLEELLPVLDNFEMGMQAAAQEKGSMLYMGMDMVHKQIGEFFTTQNVTEIPTTVGGDFDPNLHDAISQEPSSEIEDGKIIRIVRKGYQIGDRLLRPSNVTVAQSAESSESSENQPQPENE